MPRRVNQMTPSKMKDSIILTSEDNFDLRLFESKTDPDLADKILRIKYEDTQIKELEIDNVDDVHYAAWARLGSILRDNKTVEALSIEFNDFCDPMEDIDLSNFFANLLGNKSLKKIGICGVHMALSRHTMAYLSNTPSLREFNLSHCNYTRPTQISVLVHALAGRSRDTLQVIKLSYINCWEGINWEAIITTLKKMSNLRKLDLTGSTGIGVHGCEALAALLEDKDTKLEYLDLQMCDGITKSECIEVLARALPQGTKLKRLDLGRVGFSDKALMKIVEPVCNVEFTIDDEVLKIS